MPSRHNAVRLQLHTLPYDFANVMRTLALPKEVEHWSLTTLREKLAKIGARIVRHLRSGARCRPRSALGRASGLTVARGKSRFVLPSEPIWGMPDASARADPSLLTSTPWCDAARYRDR